MWHKTDIKPKGKKGEIYSYDLLIDDGVQTYKGYYSIVGDCYHAYKETILFPVERWKYLKQPFADRVRDLINYLFK